MVTKKSKKKSTGKRRSTSKRSTTSRKKKTVTKKTKVRSKTTKKSKVSKVNNKTTKELSDKEIQKIAKGLNKKVKEGKSITAIIKDISETNTGLPETGPTEKGEKLTEPPAIPLTVLRILVEMYYDFQNTRIRTGNRAAMNLKRNGIDKDALEKYGVETLFNTSKKFERDIIKIISRDLKHRRIFTDYLQNIKGISVILSAGLIAWLMTPANYENVSKVWQNAGLGSNEVCPKCDYLWLYDDILIPKTNVDGKITNTKAKRLTGKRHTCNKCGTSEHVKHMTQRKVTGYQINWNPKLKTLMWKVGGSFVLQKVTKSMYRAVYNEKRLKRNKQYPQGEQVEVLGKKRLQHNAKHLFEMCKRETTKLFLQNLWLVWRIMEGLPITKPYERKSKTGSTSHTHEVFPPVVDDGELPEDVKIALDKLGIYPKDFIPYWLKREDLPKAIEKETQELNAIPPDDAPEGTVLPDIDEDDEVDEAD